MRLGGGVGEALRIGAWVVEAVQCGRPGLSAN